MGEELVVDADQALTSQPYLAGQTAANQAM